MKRTLLLFFGVIGFFIDGISQQLETRVSDAYYRWRHGLYADLTLGNSGKTRFLELSNTTLDLQGFSDGRLGLLNDSIVLDDAYELWKLYEYGKVGAGIEEGSWDSFQVWTQQYLRQGIVPLLVIDFSYARLSDSFWLRKGYRIKEDSSGFEKIGPWREGDCISGYAFGVFPMVSVFRPEYDRLVLDPRFILTDVALPKPNGFGLEVDGVERELPIGVPLKFHWKRGLNQVRFFMDGITDSLRMALYRNPQVLKNGGKFVRQIQFWWKASWSEQTRKVFRDLPIEFGEIPVSIFDLESGEQVSSGANISIHYGRDSVTGFSRNCLKRPLVFVEGIDFGYSDMPEGCRDGKCGNVGYLDLLQGKQWNSQTGEWVAWPAIEHTPLVLKAYLDSGYDIVYVDFWKGSDWIEHNAQVLESVLKQISQRLCGDGMHVIGASMGGLVAKYALNRMEESGELGCIRSYTSFDSPHRGANIPLGMQQVSRYLQGVNRQSKDVVKRMLNARASRELLLYHHESNNGCDPKRTEFLSNKYAVALPVAPWKLGIANGSGLGIDGMQRLLDGSEMVAGSKLAEIGITEFSRTLLDSLISGCDDAVLRMLLVGSKKLLESTRIQFFSYAFDARIARKNRQLTAMATYGGGIYRDYFEVETKKSMLDHQAGGMHDGILGFKFNAVVLGGTIFADRTCFIPTWSALNLEETPFNWVKPNLTTLGSGWLQSGGIGFEEYYVPKGNQEHVFFDSAAGGNAFWLLHKLLWLDREGEQKLGGDLTWLGSETDRFVAVNEVKSGSTYSINHPAELGKLSTSMLKKLNAIKERKFYLSGCQGKELVIKTKGILRIGSGNLGKQSTELVVTDGSVMVVESRATMKLEGGYSVLRIRRGGTLVMKDEAVVEVWEGSSIIIEEGADVVFGNHVDLRLIGSGSMFHVKGKLTMDKGAELVLKPYKGIELGLMKFSSVGKGFGEFVFRGEDNAFRIIGNGKTSGVVWQLEGDIDLRQGLSTLELEELDVYLGKSTSVLLHGSIKMDQCLLGSRSWSFRGDNRWYLDSGELQFTNSMVEGLSGGLILGKDLRISEFKKNRFSDNDTGLVVLASEFSFEGNRFEDNEIGVWIGIISKGGRQIIQGYWLNNSRGLVVDSDSFAGSTPLFLRENYFVSNGLGMYSNSVSVGMACCNFAYNDTGILQRGGILAMGSGSGLTLGTDTVELRNNTFDKNNAAHLLIDGVEVYWNGSNNFSMDRSYTAVKPMVRGSLSKVGLNLKNTPELALGKVYFWPQLSGDFEATFKKHIAIDFLGTRVVAAGSLSDSLNTQCYVPLMVWNGDKSGISYTPVDVDSVYTLAKTGPVVIRIYDLQGRLLQKDSNFKKICDSVAPGIYLVEWEFGHGKEIKKVLIDK